MNDLSLTHPKTIFIFRFRRRSFDRLSKSVRRKFSPNLRSSLRTKRGRLHRLLSGKTNSNFAAAARWRTGGGEDEIKMSLKYFWDNWNLLLSFFSGAEEFLLERQHQFDRDDGQVFYDPLSKNVPGIHFRHVPRRN